MKPTNHLLAAALITALILACFAAPAAAFSGAGSGTEADPYIVTTPAQLQEINNDLDAYYQLGNDIDLTSFTTPIGSSSSPFKGTLDGNGYSMYNINTPLFYHDTASFINLELYDISISVSLSSYFGNAFGVFGYGANSVEISNIYVHDFSITATNNGGGACMLSAIGSRQTTHIHDCIVASGDLSLYKKASYSYTYAAPIGNSALNAENCYSYDVSVVVNKPSGSEGDITVSGGFSIREISNTIQNYANIVSLSTPLTCGSNSYSKSYSNRVCSWVGNHNSKTTFSNLWGLSPTVINGASITSGTSTDGNGQSVTATEAETESWWKTNLAQWDWDNIWYWDESANLPMLQVFRALVAPTITAISATPATGGQLTEYTLSATATTEAAGGITGYQWSYSTNSGTTWQAITGATSATYVWTPGTSISGAVLIKCYITGADGGTVDSYEAGYTSIQITVIPPPEIDSVSVSRPLQKVNTPTTLTATFGDIQTGNTYQWYYSTNGGTTWQAITGATQPTAEYTPTTTGLHNIKIIVTTQYGDTTETATSITVLPTYTPTPITNTSVDISIDSTAKYQGMQQFTLSSELKALNYYTPNIAHLAHDNAIYYLDSAEREVIPVSTTTGGTISAAYVGQNTGIITDTAGNTAFYSYQTNDWQYVEQSNAQIIASTSSYAATVSSGTLRIYNLNGNLVASTATTAANLAGNDATNVFVSYSGSTLTYYWVNGNSISSASQTLTHSITELHQISGTNNFIISTTANTIIVEITDAGVYSLVATSETDTPLIHTQSTSINIFIGVAAPNEIFIVGADGETDGTYVTGSTLSDASIAKATGLYAIAGGADYQAYILSKSDSSVWQLQQVVSFGGAIDYSQISTTGTHAAVATGLKLYLLESKDTSSSVYYLQGVVIGSTGKPYAEKTITINGDSIRTDTKGMFLYPVQPGNLVTITAGDTTVEYTPSSAALQQIAIRIKAGLLSTDVTYSADYSAESQAIIMAYDDAAGKTTAVNWKVYETANNTLVATYTGNTASYAIEAGDVYNNYYVQLSADRGGATVTNTWSITPAGGQPIDLYGLDEDGRNIIFGFLLLLLAGLFGVMHSRSGAIIVALGACVMRYLELITIPWILITIAAVLAIVAAIAHGGQNR